MRARLAPDIELVLYRIAQEALTNIAKHARAARALVDLERGANEVSIAVKDDGIGFERGSYNLSDGVGLGLGLFGMEERAALMGGRVQIWSEPGRGTEVFAHIPLHKLGSLA